VGRAVNGDTSTTAGALRLPTLHGFIVFGGLLITTPLLLLAFFTIEGHDPGDAVRNLCFVSSAIGLSLVSTFGGGLIGSALVVGGNKASTIGKVWRPFLGSVWVLVLGGLTYIISGYLLQLSAGEGVALAAVLSWEWLQAHPGLVLYVVAIVVVPEMCVVGVLVDGVRRVEQAASDNDIRDENGMLVDSLSRERIKVKELEGTVEKLNALVVSLRGELRTETDIALPPGVDVGETKINSDEMPIVEKVTEEQRSVSTESLTWGEQRRQVFSFLPRGDDDKPRTSFEIALRMSQSGIDVSDYDVLLHLRALEKVDMAVAEAIARVDAGEDDDRVVVWHASPSAVFDEVVDGDGDEMLEA
jgi:hypothetical protein